MVYLLKDPGGTVDYVLDWSRWLGSATISASGWTVLPDEPGGVARAAASFDASRTTITLSGGVAGKLYRLTNRIQLADGRSDERTLAVRVEDR